MKKNTFVEGTFIATFAIIITKILGVLYVIPFYKIIGEQGGDLYSYAYNVYNLFLNISTAGIPIAVSKIIRLAQKDIEDLDEIIPKCDKKILNDIIDEILNRTDLFESKKAEFKRKLEIFREKYNV